MNNVREILDYLKAIAEHDSTAVEELGYRQIKKPSESRNDQLSKISDLQYGIALTMLFLSSMNGISEGSLDVPNQSGLAYLDKTHGALYHGPQVILVSLFMLSNTIITIQQLIKSRLDTDSEKIHKDRQSELKRLHSILSYYVNEKSNLEDIDKRFDHAYSRSLHKDVQQRIIEYRDLILDDPKSINDDFIFIRELPRVNDSARVPSKLEQTHSVFGEGYGSLIDLLAKIKFIASNANDTESNEDVKKKIAEWIQNLKVEIPKNTSLYNMSINEKFNSEFEHTMSSTVLKKKFINEVIYFWILNEKSKKDESLNLFNDAEVFKLDEFSRDLEINPNNHESISESYVYRGIKNTGYTLGWINVFVNFGIGMGAFVGFCMIMFALTGISIIALIGPGWPFLLATLFFACLSMMMPFLITRIYINDFFENFAYNFKLWWDSENRYESMINALKIRKNAMTLLVTLPSAIGLTFIAAMAFYVSMPILPIAILIGIVTFIACVSLFGGMFYESYDRLEHMIAKADYNRLAVPAGIASLIMITIGLALFLNPITGPFMALAPISAILLLAVVSIIVFTMSFAIYGKWPLKKSILASLGLTAAVGQSVAIFCCAALILSTPFGLAIAAALALFSFPLFFSWAVMCVALPEDEMERHCVLKECVKSKDLQQITEVSKPEEEHSIHEQGFFSGLEYRLLEHSDEEYDSNEEDDVLMPLIEKNK